MPISHQKSKPTTQPGNQCSVWQNSKNYRSEITLSVKCDKDDQGACDNMVSVLDTKHRHNDWSNLEGWVRYNCIGTHVNTTSEPIEEKMLSNCILDIRIFVIIFFKHWVKMKVLNFEMVLSIVEQIQISK